MIYGCVCLALYDGLQDNVVEEIDRVWDEAAKEGRKELDYENDYPKLKYTLCFMASLSHPGSPMSSIHPTPPCHISRRLTH